MNPSPYGATPNPNHDFDRPIEITSVDLAKQILELLSNQKEDLIYIDPLLEGEEAKKFAREKAEASDDFGIAVMKIITQSNIPADYATIGIERLITILTTLKAFVGGTVRQYDDEILSRLMGVRSPRTGRFSDDCSTVAQKVLKLSEIRESTGNNNDDYYNPEQAK